MPARYLCPVPDAVLANHELWELAIVSDAITTPFQAVKRAELEEGELAIFIGVGGVGGVGLAVYGVQAAVHPQPERTLQGDLEPGESAGGSRKRSKRREAKG